MGCRSQGGILSSHRQYWPHLLCGTVTADGNVYHQERRSVWSSLNSIRVPASKFRFNYFT